MSAGKWFKKYESDSDESGSESDSDSSSDSSSDQSGESSTDDAAPGLNAWLKKKDDKAAGDEEGKGKILKSKKTKNEEMMDACITAIKMHLQNRDWNGLLDDLDKIQKLKARAASDGRGATGDTGTPQKLFLKGLKEIEDFFKDPKNDPKAIRKELAGKPGNKLFAKFHQTSKKLMQEHEELLAKFKPDAEEDDDDDDDEEELGDVDADDDERMQKKDKKEKKEEREAKKAQEKEEWTEEAIERKLEEILGERGKKSTDRSKIVDRLKVILAKTKGMTHMTMRILSVLLGCQMDLSESLTTVMPTVLWKQCYDSVTRLMNLAQDNPKIIIVDNDERQQLAEEEGTKKKGAKEDDRIRVDFLGTFHQVVERLGDEYIKSLQQLDPHTQDYVSRMSDEAYLLDLAERVFVHYRDGPKSGNRQQIAARVALRLMDHLHYRHQDLHKSLIQKQRQVTFEAKGKSKKGKKKGEEDKEDEKGEEKKEGAEGEGEGEGDEKTEDEKKLLEEAQAFQSTLDVRAKRTRQWVISEDITAVMKMLHSFVQKHSTEDKFKTKSLLLYIYHLALHDKYSQARDMLLMSRHNAENAEHMRLICTSQLMILYNRVLAQIGLAAFRAGEMYDCNCALNELCATARTREYLAQTIVRSFSRDKVEENVEKSRLVPFHMHINVDLLDGVHLIAATLQEVPVRAQYPHDSKHRPQSKALQRLLHAFSHQVFLGPPETTKEVIYAAFNKLTEGNWKEAHQLIMSLNCWSVMRRAEPVQEMITEKIKICALRTYLFTFSRFYASVQLKELATKYELPEEKVHSTVSKMIIRHEINAAWDQPKQCIRVESTNATKLQYLALQLADRCNALVEYNEQRQAEKEARGDRGFNPYQQKKSGGRSSYIGNKWESGAAGASRSATTTFRYNRTQDKDRKSNPFAKRSWVR